jgi:adenylate cyclase
VVNKGVTRKLAAVLAADMVGYSSLMEADEVGTLERQKTHRRELIDPAFEKYHGRIVKEMGDGVLVEFPSVVEAVQCAVDIQRAMPGREAAIDEDRGIAYRIGINLGDIIVDGDDIYGDGVNVAARLEQLAKPGGLCISGTVYDHLKQKIKAGYEDLGPVQVKNMEAPVRVYRVILDQEYAGKNFSVVNRVRWIRTGVAAAFALAFVLTGTWWLNQSASKLENSLSQKAPEPFRSSLVVIPFRNISDDAEQKIFTKGLVSDLISALGQIPQILIISESTAKQYSGKVVDVRKVASELAVSHVLTGSVQKSQDRIRVSVNLLDGQTGSTVWAERYDRELRELLSLQDKIVKNIVMGLQVKLTHGEKAHLRSRGTDSLEAWLLHTRGVTEAFKFNREANARARRIFKSAEKIDPGWAEAKTGIAWTYREAIRRGWSNDIKGDRKKGIELANQALALIQLGNLYIESGQIEKGIEYREKALELAPNDLGALAGLAWQLALIGDVKRSLALLEKSRKVSPLPPAWLIATEALVFHFNGQFEEAIRGFNIALKHWNRDTLHGRIAAAYVSAGQMDMARKQASLYLKKKPDGRISDLTKVLMFKDPQMTKW